MTGEIQLKSLFDFFYNTKSGLALDKMQEYIERQYNEYLHLQLYDAESE